MKKDKKTIFVPKDAQEVKPVSEGEFSQQQIDEATWSRTRTGAPVTTFTSLMRSISSPKYSTLMAYPLAYTG